MIPLVDSPIDHNDCCGRRRVAILLIQIALTLHKEDWTMPTSPLQEDHEQAVKAASEETGIPAELLRDIVNQARRSARLRNRGVGSAHLEAAVEAIVRAGRS